MWLATYLPHGWVAARRDTTDVAEKTAAVLAARFNVHIHNIGRFDPDGRLPAEQHPGVDQWVTAAHGNPAGVRVVGWLNGARDPHVTDTSRHGPVAESIRRFTADTRLDGVLLDFEPFTTDDPNFIRLLTTVRTANPDTWVGVCAPGTRRRWSPTFTRQVGALVNAVSPMFYDTTINDPDRYTTYVRDLLVDYRGALHGMETMVLPSLPAYKNNPWHDRAVENITTAAAGVRAAGGHPPGAAVYWWWEMTTTDKTEWSATVDAGTFG